jgi:BTB/POZ domain-containing protein 3/6
MTFRYRIGSPDQVDSNTPQVFAVDRQRLLIGQQHPGDAIFLVGEDDTTAVTIHVNPVLLGLASPLFATMFTENPDRSIPIRIRDCDATTMKSLILWILCDEINAEKGKLREVIFLADRYSVSSLSAFVNQSHDEAMKQHPWKVLTFAVESGNNNLKTKCAKYCAENLKDIIRQPMGSSGLTSREFLDTTAEAIAEVMSLNYSYEKHEMFARCMDWAENECHKQGLDPSPVNKRQVMEPFFHYFAFPRMSLEQFDGLPSTSRVLTQHEQVLIRQAIAGNQPASRRRRIVSRRTARASRASRATIASR